jgi:hypothetical protein
MQTQWKEKGKGSGTEQIRLALESITKATRNELERRWIEEAKKRAAEVQHMFINKNLWKFQEIVAKKGNLTDVKVISHRLNLLGLEGTLLIQFADGSHFTAKNSVVHFRGRRNKRQLFVRHPLTFHDVVMQPGNRTIWHPSEEKMKAHFAESPKASARKPDTPVTMRQVKHTLIKSTTYTAEEARREHARIDREVAAGRMQRGTAAAFKAHITRRTANAA